MPITDDIAHIDTKIDKLFSVVDHISTIATIQFRIMYAFQAVLLSAVVGLYFKH
jgi:ribosome-associated toxin RatA of RatAB toxin-antitoxin module